MLSDEVREKIVLALTGTTREQCRGVMKRDDQRCALGMLCTDVYGVAINRDIAYGPGQEEMYEEISHPLVCAIVRANDKGATFDEIAKLVKEWEG